MKLNMTNKKKTPTLEIKGTKSGWSKGLRVGGDLPTPWRRVKVH